MRCVRIACGQKIRLKFGGIELTAYLLNKQLKAFMKMTHSTATPHRRANLVMWDVAAQFSLTYPVQRQVNRHSHHSSRQLDV